METVTQITFDRECPCCGDVNSITVDKVAFDSWRNGELIQNAFPNMSSSEREVLKTGICSPCWDGMFS